MREVTHSGCMLILSLLLLTAGARQAIATCIVWFEFSGTVQKIEGRTITFQCPRPYPDEIAISIDERTKILLDEKSATLGGLGLGQRAHVVTVNGVPIRLEAKTK